MESPIQGTGPRKHRFVHRILLVLVAVGFTWFLIELPALTNILDYRAVLGNQFAWWPMNNIADPELIHIRRPYAHFSGVTRGGGITAGYIIPEADKTAYQWDDKYDRNGFRNASDLQSADIIVIGDSIVEGLTVPFSQISTSLLAQLQHQVVANLGQSAYGPQQELVVLKRYGLPLKPRTVIWMFSETTDLKDVVWYDLMMTEHPNFLHAFWSRSFTKIAYLYLFGVPKRSGITRSGVYEPADSKPVTVFFPANYRPLSKTDVGAIDETTRIVAEAYRLSAAQGARLIFVFVPDKFRVLQKFCRFPEQSDCRKWAVNDMEERFRRSIASVSPDIGYLDLTPPLVDAASKGILPFYPDDEHWSPAGHKIAADAINEYLRAAGQPAQAGH